MSVLQIAALIACGAVFGLGGYLRYKISARRFARRNVAGIEEFDSYGKALATRWTEDFGYSAARIAQGLSLVFIVIAVFWFRGQ